MDYKNSHMMGDVKLTFMCLMRLLVATVHGGEEAVDASRLTQVHHGRKQVNWGEVAAWRE